MTELYKLTKQQIELKAIAGSEGIDDGSFDDTFNALEGEFNEKAISIIHIVKNVDSDISELEAEIKRLTDRKKVMKNKQDSMREYLRSNMDASSITKIECPIFTITLAKGRDIAVIDDDKLIPDDLIEVSVIEKPNKAEILRRLKAGDDIPGARLEKSKTSLRIK